MSHDMNPEELYLAEKVFRVFNKWFDDQGGR